MSDKSQPELVHVITGLANGGAEAVLYRLTTTDAGYRHHVVSLMDAGKYGPLLRDAGVEVTCLDMPRGRVTFSGLVRLWRLLRKLRPMGVQTWMYHADLIGGVVARLAGVRNVFWNIRHSTLEPRKSSRMTILIARVCAGLSSFVPRTILCCAEKARQVHVALGYDNRKMVVVANGYDLASLSPDPVARRHLRSAWVIDDGVPLLGMVGRFDPLKDHENLLCALGDLKQSGFDFRCVLVGLDLDESNQVLMGWLQQYDLRENVLLLGQRSDIPAVMNALDVHVLSSQSEAFPNVLAEAMACGTPCVTTDVGDAALIVGDAGWIAPPKDPVALSGAIKMALHAMQSDATWRQQCERARLRVVENFSIEKMVMAYQQAWGYQANSDAS